MRLKPILKSHVLPRIWFLFRTCTQSCNSPSSLIHFSFCNWPYSFQSCNWHGRWRVYDCLLHRHEINWPYSPFKSWKVSEHLLYQHGYWKCQRPSLEQWKNDLDERSMFFQMLHYPMLWLKLWVVEKELGKEAADTWNF